MNTTDLDDIHNTFLAAVTRDTQPPTDVALFWHEAITMKRDASAPDATTRGGAFLKYFNGPSMVSDVPGQDFAKEKLPFKVCEALIKRNAASWDGPYSITFRYDRSGTEWTGGYSIETSQQYRDLVVGRTEIDARLIAALQKQWGSKDLTRVTLLHGVHGWKTWDPKLKLSRGFKPELLELPAEVHAAWADLVAYMRSNGVKHIYYAELFIDKPTATAREGEGIQIRYAR